MFDEAVLKKVGVRFGHYTNSKSLTGCTSFIAERGAHIGIDVRGSNTGSFNTPSFGIKSACELVHGVMLTGGSTYGLESSFGMMKYLEERNIGFATRAGVVPGVTGAVIFDLAVGDSKARPTLKDGYDAAKDSEAMSKGFAQGNIGAGTGGTVGKWVNGIRMKGGFGIGVGQIAKDVLVAAFAVTNAVGDVINPKTGEFYSKCGQQNLANESFDFPLNNLAGLLSNEPTNTTIALIATNVSLNRAQLMKVAEQAHNGMARAIHPIHTNMDGDVIFALSSLSGERKEFPNVSPASLVDLVSLAAADAMVNAINNSVIHAESIKDFPAFSSKA